MKKFLLSIMVVATTAISAQNGEGLLTIPEELGVNPDCYGSVAMGTGSNLKLSSDWTIEAWIQLPFDYSSSQVHIVETYGSLSNGGYALRISNEKIMAYAMTGSSQPYLLGTNVVPGGEWVHIAASFNESTGEMILFLNGQEDKVGTLNGADQNTYTNSLQIGARGDDNNINTLCVIDEVRIWDKPSTALEIQNTMNGCLSGNETNLLAYYNFEGFDGTTFDDLTANNNHGTVVNGASQSIAYGVFDCNGTTTGQKNELVKSSSMYPNPVVNEINIISENQINEVQILDVSGRIVLTDTQNKIDVSGLVSGTYLVRIISKGQVEIHTLLKQ